MNITKILQPGLIQIKQALNPAEQIALSKIALLRGADPNNGFWKVNELGQTVLNQDTARGRIFDALHTFPPIITELGKKSLKIAHESDKTIQMADPTHLILLYYQTLPKEHRYINWHQDRDPNDGDGEFPVISLSIGDTCDFLVCNEKPKISTQYPISNPANLSHRVTFESGDALIFGGPSRRIHHAIYKIHANTAPNFLPFLKARLNFTMRAAPQISGKEELYHTKVFKSAYEKHSIQKVFEIFYRTCRIPC